MTDCDMTDCDMTDQVKPDVLVAENVSKIFSEAQHKLVVLDNINMTVQQGEMIAIVGASGAGKTTLLQILGGLDNPTSGEVRVAGQAFGSLSPAKKGHLRNQHLGFVYQFHHLMPEFNALENVCIPLLIRGVSPKKAKEKACYYIEHVGLTDRMSHRVGELSGGERQRIAIARALVTEPGCVLADEPTGNLDEGTAAFVTELLMSLNQTLKTSFVLVTHNKVLARQMDRTLTIVNGKLTTENNGL